MFSYKKVAHAFDLNDKTFDSLEKIFHHSVENNFELHFITVHKTIFDYGYSSGVNEYTPNQVIRKEMQSKLLDLTQKYNFSSGIHVKMIEADTVYDGIIQYVRDNSIELLILNGHKHRALGRINSISSKISVNTPCDVMILKHAR